MRQGALKIAVIGECMIEMSPQADGQYALGFAGDTFNTATYLARRLGPEQAQVSYVTGVGHDTLSQRMVAHFKLEGLDTSLIQTIVGRSVGLYLIENDDKGERVFHYWRDTSAAKAMLSGARAASIAEALKGFDLVYLSGITLAILPPADRQALLDILAGLNVPLAFDPNYRSKLWRDVSEAQAAYKAVAKSAAYILTTYEDDEAVWKSQSPDASLIMWREKGAGEIIIKNGAISAHIATLDDTVEVPTREALSPLDTTGAGDAFNAAYLSERLTGANPESAALSAHELAARVIMHKGAILPKDRIS